MIHYCPNCQIGLNNSEMRLRFCQNCKHHWEEKDELLIDEEDEFKESVPLPSPAPGVVEQKAERSQKLFDALQEICFLFPEYHKAKEIATKAMANYKYPNLTGVVTLATAPPVQAVEPEKEKILCAATWYKDVPDAKIQVNGVDKGVVLCGFRHGHILHQFNALTGKRSVTTECGEYIQGFLTTKNRFVDRKEALRIAHANNQIIHSVQLDSHVGLTSEDIY